VVRGTEQQPDLGAARDRHPVDLDVLQHPPLEHLQRGVVPHEFFYRGGQHRVVGAEAGQLVRVAEQRPPTVAGDVDGGLVAGVEQQDAGADELVLGEAVALVDDVRQRADEVVAGVVTAVCGEVTQVCGELLAGADGGVLGLTRGVQLVRPDDLRRPRPQQMPVGLGHAEHLRDHRDGQRLGDGGDQVDGGSVAARVQQVVDERVRHRRDPWPQLLHGTGGERLRHEPAQAGVVGRLTVEHAVADQLPERRQVLRVRLVAHLLVRGNVQVRAAEPAVAE
jgi:hypothetical protein